MILTLSQAAERLNIAEERLKTYSGIDKYKKYFIDGGFDDSKIKEFKYFYRNENHSKGTYWTRDSILCYEHKFYCKTCPNCLICQKIPKIQDKPPIKWKVLELYSELGKPKKEVQDKHYEIMTSHNVEELKEEILKCSIDYEHLIKDNVRKLFEE